MGRMLTLACVASVAACLLLSCGSRQSTVGAPSCQGSGASLFHTLGASSDHLARAQPEPATSKVSSVYYDKTLAVVVICDMSSMRAVSAMHIRQAGSDLRVIQVATVAVGSSQALAVIFVPPTAGSLSLSLAADDTYDFRLTSQKDLCSSRRLSHRARVDYGAWADVDFTLPKVQFSRHHFIDVSVQHSGHPVRAVAFARRHSRKVHVTGPFWRGGVYRFRLGLPRTRGGAVVGEKTFQFKTHLPSVACRK